MPFNIQLRKEGRSAVFLLRRDADPATVPPQKLAGIVQMLLILGGVEENPGPKAPKTPCGVCGKNAPHSCIECTRCSIWTHFTCAGLDPHHLPRSWICRNCNQRRQPESFRILQFNCNGLKNKLDECISYMERKKCKIGLFQETFLKPATKLSHPSYSVLRKDRLRDKGGGIAILVHKDLT